MVLVRRDAKYLLWKIGGPAYTATCSSVAEFCPGVDRRKRVNQHDGVDYLSNPVQEQ